MIDSYHSGLNNYVISQIDNNVNFVSEHAQGFLATQSDTWQLFDPVKQAKNQEQLKILKMENLLL